MKIVQAQMTLRVLLNDGHMVEVATTPLLDHEMMPNEAAEILGQVAATLTINCSSAMQDAHHQGMIRDKVLKAFHEQEKRRGKKS